MDRKWALGVGNDRPRVRSLRHCLLDGVNGVRRWHHKPVGGGEWALVEAQVGMGVVEAWAWVGVGCR